MGPSAKRKCSWGITQRFGKYVPVQVEHGGRYMTRNAAQAACNQLNGESGGKTRGKTRRAAAALLLVLLLALSGCVIVDGAGDAVATANAAQEMYRATHLARPAGELTADAEAVKGIYDAMTTQWARQTPTPTPIVIPIPIILDTPTPGVQASLDRGGD